MARRTIQSESEKEASEGDYSPDVVDMSDKPAPEAEPKESYNKKGERMYPASDIKELIANEIARLRGESDTKSVKKVKRVQEHHVPLKRWNAKWVVDFIDQNNDPYLKIPIHAFNVWNPELRQNIAHIELVLLDEETGEKTTEKVALTRYLEHRIPINCLIIKRHQEDKTYSIGEVEIKKESKDGMMRGTGVYRDQEVIMHQEIFELKTPRGDVFMIPDYAIC